MSSSGSPIRRRRIRFIRATASVFFVIVQKSRERFPNQCIFFSKKNISTSEFSTMNPPIRPGFNGMIDQFIGPGATTYEMLLQFIPACFALVAQLYYSIFYTSQSTLQILLGSMLTFDIVGGILTNSTPSAKRWYHRKSQTFWNHFQFILLHLVHICLVSFLFYSSHSLLLCLFHACFLLLSSLCILFTPLALQRTVSYLWYTIALVCNIQVLPSPNGMQWFFPLFYFKLLVSHLVKEEPYS